MTLPTGQLVVGVGNGALVAHGIITRAESYGVVDDSKVHPGTEKCKPVGPRIRYPGTDEAVLTEYCPSSFENWGDQAKGEGLMRVWSGIMCSSRDTLPLVGQVPGKAGMWIAVGFHGEFFLCRGAAGNPADTKRAWHVSYPSYHSLTGPTHCPR
jgi:hypothetical protein